MTRHGDMYRSLAAEKRKEAEEYERKAVNADLRELENREAERVIAGLDPQVIQKARALYREDPIMRRNSDDSYSQWIEPTPWDQLHPVTQLHYINRTCSDY